MRGSTKSSEKTMKLYTLDDRKDGEMRQTPEWTQSVAGRMCWRCGMLDRRFGLPDVQLVSPYKLHAHIWGMYREQILILSTQFAEFIGWDIIHRDLITSRLLHADGSVQETGIACWPKEVRLLRSPREAKARQCEGCGKQFYSGQGREFVCDRTQLTRSLYADRAGGLLVTKSIAERLQSPAAKSHFRPRLNLRFTPIDVLPEPIDGHPELPDAWLTPTSPDDPPLWQNAVPFAAKKAAS